MLKCLMSLPRITALLMFYAAVAHGEGLGVMDRCFLVGEKLELRGVSLREGISVSVVSGNNVLVAYTLGDDIQAVLGAAKIEVETTPWGPVIIARGNSFLRITHKDKVKLIVASKGNEEAAVLTIGSDGSQKTQGKFATYEYTLGDSVKLDLPEGIAPLFERVPNFLLTAPAYARAGVRKGNAEQGGADQPATASESKPEGEEKTQPDSKDRPK